MRWTAVVPLKLGPGSKSRLADVLSEEERAQLVQRMARHVITRLGTVDGIAEILVLSPVALHDLPAGHQRDHGRGLNAELADVAAKSGGGLLVIHADLPFLRASDIASLISAPGNAIAPDHHGSGTNALALRQMPDGFRFAFGPGSFAAHSAALGQNHSVVCRRGLARDIDTPADLAFAARSGVWKAMGTGKKLADIGHEAMTKNCGIAA